MQTLDSLIARLGGTDKEIAKRFGWPRDWRDQLSSRENRKFRRQAFTQLSSGLGSTDKLETGLTRGQKTGYNKLR